MLVSNDSEFRPGTACSIYLFIVAYLLLISEDGPRGTEAGRVVTRHHTIGYDIVSAKLCLYGIIWEM